MPEVRSVRNLFSLREAVPPAPAYVQPALTTLPAPAVVEPAAPLPALIGLTERRAQGAVERLAIFAVGDEPVIAAVGAVVLGRLSVTAISADAVALLDRTTGVTHVLVLR